MAPMGDRAWRRVPVVEVRSWMVPLVAAALFAAVAGGCSSGDGTSAGDSTARSSDDVSTSATVAISEKSPVQAALAKLTSVSTNDLRMGAAFNHDLVSIGMRSMGFDVSESACIADAVAASMGEAFDRTPVASLFGSDSMSPQVLLGCTTLERAQELASGADAAQVPEAEMRQVLVGLASAGYEQAGLTPAEATCLAADAVATLEDDGSFAALQSGGLSDGINEAALRRCVSDDRIVELAK